MMTMQVVQKKTMKKKGGKVAPPVSKEKPTASTGEEEKSGEPAPDGASQEKTTEATVDDKSGEPAPDATQQPQNDEVVPDGMLDEGTRSHPLYTKLLDVVDYLNFDQLAAQVYVICGDKMSYPRSLVNIADHTSKFGDCSAVESKRVATMGLGYS